MTILNVLLWPDKRLSTPAAAVPADYPAADLQTLLSDMADTMRHHKAAGLAATQVGVALRVFVIENPSGIQYCVNPVFDKDQASYGALQTVKEGCLSFPGLVVSKRRHASVRLSCEGVISRIRQELELEGIAAQAAQHEMEHLDGKTFATGWSPTQVMQMKVKLAPVDMPMAEPGTGKGWS